MSEINLEATCQLFDTGVMLQYQSRLKLKDTIKERYGLRGTHLNIQVSALVEMNQMQLNVSPISTNVVKYKNSRLRISCSTD
jgi:hypothetical protein